MTHHLKFYAKKYRSVYIKIFGVSLIFITALYIIFLFTRGNSPHVSELSFIENSILGNKAGSVVPASCNSSPPESHFAGDCTTNLDVSLGFGALSSAVGLVFYPTSHFVSYGAARPTFTWTVSGATACLASGGWSGSKSTAGGSELITYTNAALDVAGSATIPVTYYLSCGNNGKSIKSMSFTVYYFGAPSPTCSNGALDYPACTPPGGGGGCFLAGTQVTMANGAKKNIEDVTYKDKLMTSAGPERVMKRYVIAYKGDVYAFNGDGNYFVTPTHPFMTTDGWKSLDPEGTRRESPGIQVSKLTIGDTLILNGGITKKLTQLDSKYMETTVYNFGVNGTHDFYADNYLVHNVDMSRIWFQRAYAQMAK